jgi:hypothetical protein
VRVHDTTREPHHGSINARPTIAALHDLADEGRQLNGSPRLQSQGFRRPNVIARPRSFDHDHVHDHDHEHVRMLAHG